MSDGHTQSNWRLGESDIQAMDALIENGWDIERVPSGHRPRAACIAALFARFDCTVEDRQDRVRRVLAAAAVSAEAPARLSGDDAEALDAWVLSGFDTVRVPGVLRDRARAHERLGELVTLPTLSVSASQRRDLVERTLALAARDEEALPESFRFEPAPVRNRWADLLSVAAVLLIAASVLWPVMSTVRDQGRRSMCNGNMVQVARALGGYANDHGDALPMTTAGFGGGTWWEVGRDPEHSNSANLYTLARERYVGLSALACPGNPNAPTAPASPDARDWSSIEELSYSYRVMAHPERELWGSPGQLIVVADRSPVVLRAVRGQLIFPFESSPNHSRRGQHGLAADGSAQWLESPRLPSGDNIWLPKSIEIMIDEASRRVGLAPLEGTEAPADRQDSFVGP